MFEHAFDLDSHEFMPIHFFPEYFGEAGRRVMEIEGSRPNVGRANDTIRPDITGDNAPIDQEDIWVVKGPGAPGAIDMNRRIEVLDAMGVDRQLVFPGFGFLGLMLASFTKEAFEQWYPMKCPADLHQLGMDAIRAHNDWTMSLRKIRDRERHVAIVPTFEFDEMMLEAERVAAGGSEALWISSIVPPGGTSPANPKMDRFWSLAEEADLPVVLHLNPEPFIPIEWFDAPQFRRQTDSELPIGTYFLTIFSFSIENFLASMIAGGVFERHPKLRFGIIECGSQWLAPLIERMEMIWDFFGQTRDMSRRPTEYVVDQVRVTPFHFEPMDLYLDRHPQLADVYCFSSDYPHSEGGPNAMRGFEERIRPFGDEMLAKFFRKNAELLMPA